MTEENKNLENVADATEVETLEQQDEFAEGDENQKAELSTAAKVITAIVTTGVGGVIVKAIHDHNKKKQEQAESKPKKKKGGWGVRSPFYKKECVEEPQDETTVAEVVEEIVDDVKSKTSKKDKH